MTGDDTRLPFGLLFSLRSHALRQPTLTALTFLAITSSVALAVALRMSSESIGVEFTRTARALAGETEIEVTAGAVGLPEALFAEVEQVPGVRSAAPVIEVTVRHSDGPLAGEALHILGVDLLADDNVRSYALIRRDLRIRDAPMLLASPESILISELLARRAGLEERDVLHVRSAHGRHDLVVRGVLAAGGLADAYGGQVAVMDVFSLQLVLGREGWIDRIDVVLEEDEDPEAVLAALNARVAGRASVRRRASARSYTSAAMSTLRLAAGVFAGVGILVATLLAYGAMSISVERRTREFALLRAAGLESRRVRHLVRLDSLVVAGLGTLLGLPAGVWLSEAFIAVLSGTSSFLDDVPIGTTDLGGDVLLIGLAVGLGVSLLGSLAPARRASLPPPLEVLSARGSPARTRRGGLAPARVGRFVLAVAAALSLSLPLPPLVRSLAVFGTGLLGVVLLLDPLLDLFFRDGRPRLERIVPGVGRLAGGSLRTRRRHARIAVSSIAALVAAVASISTVLTSLERTVDASAAGTGDAMITASDPFASLQRELITAETARAVEGTPGVRAVFHHFHTQTVFRGERIGISAISSRVIAKHGALPIVSGGSTVRVARGLERGGVLVSEAFARHFGIGSGQSLTLDTPVGPRRFPVVGIGRDYASGPSGSLRMDLAVFDALWPRNGSSNLLVWTDGSREEVLRRIQRRAGQVQALFFFRSEELARFMHDLVGRYSFPLHLLGGLMVLLGGVAILNLLIGSVLERRRDLALLRAAGATSRQIMALVLLDAWMVAGVGTGVGIALGLACSGPMNGVLTEAFGWALRYTLAPASLAWLVAGVLAAATAAALYPGWVAVRSDPLRALAPE
ncbi:MAG: ABC transporter permease [Myxococcota bacterium]